VARRLQGKGCAGKRGCKGATYGCGVVHPIDEACNSFTIWQWHVPVCALFKGRLVDTPESPMPRTEHSSGGEVEHEVSMAEGILLDVTELKFYLKSERDHLECKYFF